MTLIKRCGLKVDKATGTKTQQNPAQRLCRGDAADRRGAAEDQRRDQGGRGAPEVEVGWRRRVYSQHTQQGQL